MASRVLHHPKLRAAIEAETSPESLQDQFQKCPVLTATYYETIRTVTSSISAREVISECIIGNLQFQPGTRVIIPSRQTLVDDNVVGTDAKSFDINRFLHNPGLEKSHSFRPFGGGKSYCPGRFMAMKEAMSSTVLVLREFDVEIFGEKQVFPRMDTAKLCLGVMDSVDGNGLLLRVSRKAI